MVILGLFIGMRTPLSEFPEFNQDDMKHAFLSSHTQKKTLKSSYATIPSWDQVSHPNTHVQRCMEFWSKFDFDILIPSKHQFV